MNVRHLCTRIAAGPGLLAATPASDSACWTKPIAARGIRIE